MAVAEKTIVKSNPSFKQKLILSQFRKTLSKCDGQIKVSYPDGKEETLGKNTSLTANLNLNDYSFFNRISQSGDIGLAESYLNNEWESDNLTNLYKFFTKNINHIEVNTNKNLFVNLIKIIKHRSKHNSLKNSQKNIANHYDLGNDFYKLFLDKSMTYSCAFFKNKNQSLDQGQEEKISKIINKLQAKKEHHVLEIGSGWGSLAIEIAKRVGCHVTSLTLSKEQLNYARNAVKEAGLEDKVSICFEDYRSHNKSYDRIVSIEMIEAVGHKYMNTYAEHIDKNLNEQGLALIQAIMIKDQQYNNYRKKTDFIQQYIFPGGHLPSLQYFTNILSSHTNLMIDNLENIGQHYSKTLEEWKRRCELNKEKIISMYDERFYKLWDTYLSYCSAGFSERYIYCYQLVLSKHQNTYLIDSFNERLSS